MKGLTMMRVDFFRLLSSFCELKLYSCLIQCATMYELNLPAKLPATTSHPVRCVTLPGMKAQPPASNISSPDTPRAARGVRGVEGRKRVIWTALEKGGQRSSLTS